MMNQLLVIGTTTEDDGSANSSKKRSATSCSLKSLVYDPKTGDLLCSKSTYAVVCQTLKSKHLLDRVLSSVFNEDDNGSGNGDNSLLAADGAAAAAGVKNRGLLYVLLYELLLGPNKKIRGGGALKRKLMRAEAQLREALQREQEQNEASGRGGSLFCNFPRYVRINTLRSSMKEVVDWLSSKQQQERRRFEVYRDRHVPDLLVLPSSATSLLLSKSSSDRPSKTNDDNDKNASPLRRGGIVLQDKSSCFPALCLVRGFDRCNDDDNSDDSNPAKDYLDACAAPGNKTTHLAALISLSSTADCTKKPEKKMKRKGSDNTRISSTPTTVFALDRSKDRLELLQKRVRELVSGGDGGGDDTRAISGDGTVEIVTQQRDFLATKPDEYATVGSILLDPSCSGSGIYTSLDRIDDTADGNDDNADSNGNHSQRITSLSGFQCKALRHAMSFPTVTRIVYSTCSVHVEENEGVVARALNGDGDAGDAKCQQQRDNWEIVSPRCLSNWTRRGLQVEGLTKEESECLIRADKDDETNGFFVCCLQRKGARRSIDKLPPPSYLVPTELEGIPLYDGQFAVTATSVASNQRDNASAAKAIASNKKRPASSAVDDETKDKSRMISNSKKRLKKLAWKQRQQQARRERLESHQQKKA